MSTDRRRETQKFSNANLNGVFATSKAQPGGTGGSGVSRGGMLHLSLPKRTKPVSTTTGQKLLVPKPVNLPSIKKEHQGNDPSTQLVPSSAAGSGWSKPEEPQQQPQPQPEVRQSALTAGSTWASQNRAESSGWVPPTREGPYAAAGKGSFPGERHLNPEEYPSLAAIPRERPQPRKQLEQHAAHQQDLRWGDDDRDVSSHFRPPPDDVDDERYAGDRANFDERFAPPFRGGYAREYTERAGRFGAADDEYDFRASGSRADWTSGSSSWRDRDREGTHFRGYGAEGRGYGDAAGYTAEERTTSYDPYSDRDLLLPPPPPPRSSVPAAPGAEEAAADGPAAVESEEEVDLDRLEFEAELARVAAEMEQKKQEDSQHSQTPQPPPPPPPLVKEGAAAATVDQRQPPPPPPQQRQQPVLLDKAHLDRLQAERAAAAAQALEEASSKLDPAVVGQQTDDEAVAAGVKPAQQQQAPQQAPEVAAAAAKAAKEAAAARAAARAKELAEEDQRRKAAAAEKLRKLEEQMAARQRAAQEAQASAKQQLEAEGEQAVSEPAAEVSPPVAAANESHEAAAAAAPPPPAVPPALKPTTTVAVPPPPAAPGRQAREPRDGQHGRSGRHSRSASGGSAGSVAEAAQQQQEASKPARPAGRQPAGKAQQPQQQGKLQQAAEASRTAAPPDSETAAKPPAAPAAVAAPKVPAWSKPGLGVMTAKFGSLDEEKLKELEDKRAAEEAAAKAAAAEANRLGSRQGGRLGSRGRGPRGAEQQLLSRDEAPDSRAAPGRRGVRDNREWVSRNSAALPAAAGQDAVTPDAAELILPALSARDRGRGGSRGRLRGERQPGRAVAAASDLPVSVESAAAAVAAATIAAAGPGGAGKPASISIASTIQQQPQPKPAAATAAKDGTAERSVRAAVASTTVPSATATESGRSSRGCGGRLSRDGIETASTGSGSSGGGAGRGRQRDDRRPGSRGGRGDAAAAGAATPADAPLATSTKSEPLLQPQQAAGAGSAVVTAVPAPTAAASTAGPQQPPAQAGPVRSGWPTATAAVAEATRPPPSAPQAIPGSRGTSLEGSATAAAEAANNADALGAQIAKNVVSMTLDDPLNESVNLPASLDPTPPREGLAQYERHMAGLGGAAGAAGPQDAGHQVAAVPGAAPAGTGVALGGGGGPGLQGLQADLTLGVMGQPKPHGSQPGPPAGIRPMFPGAPSPSAAAMAAAHQQAAAVAAAAATAVAAAANIPRGPGLPPFSFPPLHGQQGPPGQAAPGSQGPVHTPGMWAPPPPLFPGMTPPPPNLAAAVHSMFSSDNTFAHLGMQQQSQQQQQQSQQPGTATGHDAPVGSQASSGPSISAPAHPPMLAPFSPFGPGPFAPMGGLFAPPQPFVPTGRQPDWSTGLPGIPPITGAGSPAGAPGSQSGQPGAGSGPPGAPGMLAGAPGQQPTAVAPSQAAAPPRGQPQYQQPGQGYQQQYQPERPGGGFPGAPFGTQGYPGGPQGTSGVAAGALGSPVKLAPGQGVYGEPGSSGQAPQQTPQQQYNGQQPPYLPQQSYSQQQPRARGPGPAHGQQNGPGFDRVQDRDAGAHLPDDILGLGDGPDSSTSSRPEMRDGPGAGKLPPHQQRGPPGRREGPPLSGGPRRGPPSGPMGPGPDDLGSMMPGMTPASQGGYGGRGRGGRGGGAGYPGRGGRGPSPGMPSQFRGPMSMMPDGAMQEGMQQGGRSGPGSTPRHDRGGSRSNTPRNTRGGGPAAPAIVGNGNAPVGDGPPVQGAPAAGATGPGQRGRGRGGRGPSRGGSGGRGPSLPAGAGGAAAAPAKVMYVPKGPGQQQGSS